MSVDSCTVDAEDWQGADSCTIGDVGGGLLGSEIVVGGFLYNDLTLPADAAKEICGRVTYWPPGLNLRTDEDGGLIASGADGTYTAMYQLYVDYAVTGPETPITFTFGALSAAVAGAIGWTEAADSFYAYGTVSTAPVTAAVAWTEAPDTFVASGTAAGPSTVSATMGWIESPDTFAATAELVASVTASANWIESADSFACVVASVSTFARAPSGDGYRPRAQAAQLRPAQIQGYNR